MSLRSSRVKPTRRFGEFGVSVAGPGNGRVARATAVAMAAASVSWLTSRRRPGRWRSWRGQRGARDGVQQAEADLDGSGSVGDGVVQFEQQCEPVVR